MKRNACLAVVLLLVSFSSYAQETASAGAGAVSSSIQVSEVNAPTSNIDMLQQSLTQQKTAADTAVSPAPKPSSAQPQASAPQTASSTLEMPINMGGNAASVVKTQVQPRKTVSGTKTSVSSSARTTKQTVSKVAPSKTSAKPTELEKAIEKENALLPQNRQKAASAAEEEELSQEEQEEAAEVEVAVRMLRQAKNSQKGGRTIPPPAAKNATATVPSAKARRFNPNVYRPGVQWKESQSKNFTVYTQKRDIGSGTANMTAVFEQAYNTLKRNIPWMMSDRVRVFVYQDYQSYLKYEPNAKPWSRALAYPTRGEIVVYDEPNKTQELKEMFTHELVHIFTQKFFDKRRTYQIMTPAWLDEGLAVLMEDQAYNGTQGGPWAQDFKTLNFQRDPSSRMSLGWNSSPTNMMRKPGRTLTFMPFDQFMKEGSLNMMESNGQAQDWYFQAYTMVRFLLNPGNSSYPSKRMQFEQFTKLLAEGEAVRDPSSGFLKRDASGKQIYEPYSVEKALKKVYYYNDMNAFEDAFWKWASSGGSGYSL